MVKRRVADNSVDVDTAPTEDDLREADAKDGPNTLMQMMYANFHGPTLQKVLYFSTMDQINIHLIRKEFAEKLGYNGKPYIQIVQTSNRNPEAWNTKAYWVLQRREQA